MKQRILIPVLIFILAFLTLAVSSVSANEPQQTQQPVATPVMVRIEGADFASGNYCVSCHLAEDPRLATATKWDGGALSEVNSPCPAATKIHEELNYIERMLLMIDNTEASVGSLPETAQARLDGYAQRYSRMLDVPVNSLDAFMSEAQAARYQMNKAYMALNDMAEAAKARSVLIYAGGVTVIVLASLAWGFYNTRAIRAGTRSKSGAIFWRAAFVLAVLLLFTLPIFRLPAAEVEIPTTEQQEAQVALDTAQRAADAADRTQARAWMLSRIAVAWGTIDTEQAQILLDESLASLADAHENEKALWGQSLAVQEVTAGTLVDMESAGLIAADLNSARVRNWALPVIAQEWSSLDPEKATALLQAEQDALIDGTDLYRDLQMRSVALAWAKVDASKAVPATAEIVDPLVQAWTLRELAVLVGDESLFESAAEAARAIDDPAQRARALGEVAAASGETDLFAEALTALEEVSPVSLAYALSDLAAVAGDVSMADDIDMTYPDARASAYLRLGEYESAWKAAGMITDPYLCGRAEAAIAAAWNNVDAAMDIEVPLYRDIALRDIAMKTRDRSLVDSMSLPYYKVQTLTALGNLDAALELADELDDTYPLVALAVAIAENDYQAALVLVDKMSRETDKAAALQAIAMASHDEVIFEQAQGMALAARVRGDPLAPAQALLDLAQALWSAHFTYAQNVFQQAYTTTQRIAVK